MQCRCFSICDLCSYIWMLAKKGVIFKKLNRMDDWPGLLPLFKAQREYGWIIPCHLAALLEMQTALLFKQMVYLLNLPDSYIDQFGDDLCGGWISKHGSLPSQKHVAVSNGLDSLSEFFLSKWGRWVASVQIVFFACFRPEMQRLVCKFLYGWYRAACLLPLLYQEACQPAQK